MADEKAEQSATKRKLLIFNYSALGALKQVEVPEFVPVPRGEKKPEKPTALERSCEGALHFRPGSTVMLTKQEHEFLKEHAPELARQLLFVAEEKDAEAPAAPVASAAPSGPTGGTGGSDDPPAGPKGKVKAAQGG